MASHNDKTSVVDADSHFIIDPVTRTIQNDGEKKLVQFDHNSERKTFECPRFVEGHDMLNCNRVIVNYLDNDLPGVYEVDDLTKKDSDTIMFSWLISSNATQKTGNIFFAITFMCVQTNGDVTYRWNTAINQGLKVIEGMNQNSTIVYDNVDILEQWKQQLFGTSDGEISKIQKATNECLKQIPSDYSNLNTKVDKNTTSISELKESLDELQDTIDGLGSGGGLSSTFISALQTILTHAIFESDQSQNIQSLTKYGQETQAKVTSINAVYNGGPVMSGTNILSLKDNIVVTAVYEDGTQETITDYTITGNIKVGSNTLTIKYGRKTTTITVIGTDATHVYSLSNQKFEENTTIDTGIAINDQDRDFTITIDITLLSAATTYCKARMIWKNESNKSIITAMIDNGKIKFAYMDTAETEVYLGSVDSGVSGNDLFDHVYIVLRHKLGEKTLYMKFKGVNTSKKSYTNEKTITANNMKFDDAHLMIGSYNNQLQFLLNATINSLDIYYKAFSDEEVTEFINQN